MTDSRFVTLRHVSDPVEAEMFVDLLGQEGIPASIPGNQHSALLGGLAASAIRVPLQVPESEVERARAILSALEDYDEVDPQDAAASAPDVSAEGGGGPYRGGPAEDTPPDRKKSVAVAAALLFPMVIGAFGAGHFYVRSYPRGFGLLAAAWGCIVLGLSGQGWAWMGLPVVLLADIAGAIRLIARRSS